MNKYYSWIPIENKLYSWSHSLENIINSHDIPNLKGEEIYIGSDYSGNQADSKYNVYSILYVDLLNSKEWEIQRRLVRNVFLPDGRKMSYKGLNDQKKRDALIPFLRAADKIMGVSLTLIVSKAVPQLCLNKHDLAIAHKAYGLKTIWKYKSLETAMRVCYLISTLIAGLSKPGQNISWISDEDDMFSNNNKSIDVQRILGAFSSMLVHHNLGELGMGTTAIDPGDYLEEDITAVPDLIAGALAETATKIATLSNGKISSLVSSLMPYNLSIKARTMCSWIWDSKNSLKKIVVKIEDEGDGKFAISRLDLISMNI